MPSVEMDSSSSMPAIVTCFSGISCAVSAAEGGHQNQTGGVMDGCLVRVVARGGQGRAGRTLSINEPILEQPTTTALYMTAIVL